MTKRVSSLRDDDTVSTRPVVGRHRKARSEEWRLTLTTKALNFSWDSSIQGRFPTGSIDKGGSGVPEGEASGDELAGEGGGEGDKADGGADKEGDRLPGMEGENEVDTANKVGECDGDGEGEVLGDRVRGETEGVADGSGG